MHELRSHMLIDAHVHYTPPVLAADLDGLMQQEPYWGLMLAPVAGGKSVQGWATAERMIADMDAAGVAKVVLMGEYRRTQEGCRVAQRIGRIGEGRTL